MPSPAPSTFLAILIIAVLLIVWWRAALVLLAAFLIAVLVTGMHEVVGRIDLHSVRTVETAGPVHRTGDAPDG